LRRAAPLAALLGFFACRTWPPEVVLPLPADDPTARARVEQLAEQAQTRHSLRARVKLALDHADGSLRVEQRVAALRPAKLRIEVLGFLGQTEAVLVTDGVEFAFFRARDRALTRGEVYPRLLYDLAHIPLTPAGAVQVLLGAVAPAPELHVAAAARLGEDQVRVDLADAAGALRQRFEFAHGGLLRRAQIFASEDALAWEAIFAAYERVEPEGFFAHTIEVHFSESQSNAVLSLKAVELNPELPEDLFSLHLQPARQSTPPVGAPLQR